MGLNVDAANSPRYSRSWPTLANASVKCGEGGVIVLDRSGHAALTYSSEGMYRGYLTRDGKIQVMIFDK